MGGILLVSRQVYYSKTKERPFRLEAENRDLRFGPADRQKFSFRI
jgi:hypothetical protein